MQMKEILKPRDVLVLIVIVILILALQPILSGSFKLYVLRVTCGTNLKGLHTAMESYSYDYHNKYPAIGGKDAPWTKKLGWAYDETKVDYSYGGKQASAGRTITASWYLLVREADVDPKSFICKPSGKMWFIEGANQKLEDLWDFGNEPYKHVSYAMQMPFGKYPAASYSTSSDPIAGDMSPWFKDGEIVKPGTGEDGPGLITADERKTHKHGNSRSHNGTGQNVLFGDGRVEFTKTSNVGVKNDNIYTFWSSADNPTEQDRQGGSRPAERSKETDSKAAADSFLAI